MWNQKSKRTGSPTKVVDMRRRRFFTTSLEVAGMGSIAVGFFLVNVALGLMVTGVALLALSAGITRRKGHQ